MLKYVYYLSCQWLCSGDQTLPGGGVPGDLDTGSFCSALILVGIEALGSSCQWLCSGDHTLPGGAGSEGRDDLLFGWSIKGLDLLLLLLTVGSDSNSRYQNNPNIIIKMSIQGCKDLILSCPWQTLYFLPLPQWQESFRPSFLFKSSLWNSSQFVFTSF